MQISIESLCERVDALAGLDGVDPGSLTGDDAAQWVSALAGVRTAADAMIAVLARRIEELTESQRFARAKGFSGAPTLIAQKGQMSTSEAGRLLGLGRSMAGADADLGDEVLLVGSRGASEPRVLHEATARAVAAGEFGSDKAAVIRALLDTLSEPSVDLERRLVRLAPRLTLKELQGRCDRELEADHVALEQRDRRQRDERYISFFREADGMVGIRGRLDAVTAAPLLSRIEGEVRALMGRERDLPDGERREEGQVRADVFAAMALHAMGCELTAGGVKSVVVVQVSSDTVAAGAGVAECHGLSGPISWWAARQICVDAAIMPAVMGEGSLPLDLGRAKRLFTPEQRAAIALRDKGCAKCGAPVNRCDVHHIVYWADGGTTDISNGLLLCVGCHHRLHDYDWKVNVEGDDVWFIPPASTDPERRRQPSCATRLSAHTA